MQCKHTTCWLFLMPFPPGFWWVAENVEHHKGNSGTVRGQCSQNFHVPIVTHHAVHRGTVCRADHHWNGNLFLVGFNQHLYSHCPDHLMQTNEITSHITAETVVFSACCHLYELLKHSHRVKSVSTTHPFISVLNIKKRKLKHQCDFKYFNSLHIMQTLENTFVSQRHPELNINCDAFNRTVAGTNPDPMEDIHNNRVAQIGRSKLFTSTIIWICTWAQFALFDSVEHFSLHAVLKLAPPQHQVEDFVDAVLWILLLSGTNRRINSHYSHMEGKLFCFVHTTILNIAWGWC